MKRRILALLLAALTLAALTTAAFAADPTGKGVYNIRTTNGYKLTVDGVENKGFYATADKFDLKLNLSCTNLSGQYSLVFLLNAKTGETTIYPTEGNIYYIDQQSVNEKAAAFDLIPKELAEGTYYVYVSTNGESGQSLKKVASFEYGEYPGYMLGDVCVDGDFDARDALYALQIAAGLNSESWSENQVLAAHVCGKADVSAADALKILQRAAGLISSF